MSKPETPCPDCGNFCCTEERRMRMDDFDCVEGDCWCDRCTRGKIPTSKDWPSSNTIANAPKAEAPPAPIQDFGPGSAYQIEAEENSRRLLSSAPPTPPPHEFVPGAFNLCVHKTGFDTDTRCNKPRDQHKPASSAPVSEPPKHPEETCGRCGGKNIHAWHAPSPLWNAVMRKGERELYGGIVCPRCFAEIADSLQVVDSTAVWCLRLHQGVVVELADAFDGRVWDPVNCLCVEPCTPVPAGNEGRFQTVAA